jgi:hypothetical protein
MGSSSFSSLLPTREFRTALVLLDDVLIRDVEDTLALRIDQYDLLPFANASFGGLAICGCKGAAFGPSSRAPLIGKPAADDSLPLLGLPGWPCVLADATAIRIRAMTRIAWGIIGVSLRSCLDKHITRV